MPNKIYTRRYCSYCVRAKQLLDQLGVEYTEIPVDGNPQAYQESIDESGRYTFPQIWIGSEHVGGCDDLFSLYHSGKLTELLQRQS